MVKQSPDKLKIWIKQKIKLGTNNNSSITVVINNISLIILQPLPTGTIQNVLENDRNTCLSLVSSKYSVNTQFSTIWTIAA